MAKIYSNLIEGSIEEQAEELRKFFGDDLADHLLGMTKEELREREKRKKEIEKFMVKQKKAIDSYLDRHVSSG